MKFIKNFSYNFFLVVGGAWVLVRFGALKILKKSWDEWEKVSSVTRFGDFCTLGNNYFTQITHIARQFL